MDTGKTDEKLVEAIIEFINNGEYTGTEYSPKDFINKMGFLKHIMRRPSGDTASLPVGVHLNTNWFWCPANDKNRNDLVSDLTLPFEWGVIEAQIYHRYEKEDGYGILKPLKRDREFNYNKHIRKIHDSLLQEFNLNSQSRYGDEDCFYKLNYCKHHNKALHEFLTWYWAESLVGVPINFVESQVVSVAVYGDIEELGIIYMSKEYKDIVSQMRTLLEVHRKNRNSIAEKIIQDMKDDYYSSWSKNTDFAKYAERVKSLYEAPDGVSAEAKSQLTSESLVFLNEISEFTNLPF